MKKGFLKRVLGATLAFVMGVSMPFTSFAQSDVEELAVEEELVEEFAAKSKAPAATYTVNYELGEFTNAKITKPIYTYKSGKKYALPKASVPGYTFAGWLFDEQNAAYLTRKKYKIDGEEIELATHINANAQGDMTFYPFFVPVKVKVYVMPNGTNVVTGEGRKVSGKKYVGTVYYGYGPVGDDYNDDFLDDWHRNGYELAGLSQKPKADPASDELVDMSPDAVSVLKSSGTLTLYCIWNPNRYGIYYADSAICYEDGEAVEKAVPEEVLAMAPDSHVFGKATVLPKLSMEGYTFLGWNLVGDAAEVKQVKVKKTKNYVTQIKADNSEELCLQPVFSQQTYKLSFNAQGGKFNGKKSGVLSSSVAYFDDVAGHVSELNGANVTRKGYALKGFSLDAKGKTGLVTDSEGKPLGEDGKLILKSSKPVTLYAIWEKH